MALKKNDKLSGRLELLDSISGMKERNENLRTNNFHYPFTSFGCDDDVIFLSTKF